MHISHIDYVGLGAPMNPPVHLIIYYYASDTGGSPKWLGIPSQLIYIYLRQMGIRCNLMAVSSPEMIGRNIRKENPTHVAIMAPWINPGLIRYWCREWPEIQFAIVCHSNLAFLGADPKAASLMLQYAELSREMHNFHLAANAAVTSAWAAIVHNADVITLPNLYWINEHTWRARQPYNGGPIEIGMFGAGRILKNFATGAGAVLVLQRQMGVTINLHTNVGIDGRSPGEVKMPYEMIQADPHVNWINEGWLPWPAFTRLLGRMYVLIQPTVSESFNVVTADGIARGVSSAVGPAISWVPDYWKANTEDPTAFASVMRHLLTDPHAAYDGKNALMRYSSEGYLLWKEWLLTGATAMPRAWDQPTRL
jgi:hypothetical protein